MSKTIEDLSIELTQFLAWLYYDSQTVTLKELAATRKSGSTGRIISMN